jgi:hypothetical protein
MIGGWLTGVEANGAVPAQSSSFSQGNRRLQTYNSRNQPVDLTAGGLEV